jgi:membrane-bound serine protease (ClpP class)
VSEPISGVVEVITPSIGQLIVGLDGSEVVVAGESRSLATARTEVENGIEVRKPSVDVRFHKPGLVDRTLRIAVQPEAAYLFLMIGLALITFEFYAAGPGLAAAVGVVALLLAGYGLASLPVNWWALALSLVGIALYLFEFQRNALGVPSLIGTVLLVVGGLLLNRGAPQVVVAWWAVALTVAFTALFFGVALTTVARARFSTPTIGRDRLIGGRGSAETTLDPDGVVVIDGARWRARARRGAGLGPGDPIVVIAIDGVILEVESKVD